MVTNLPNLKQFICALLCFSFCSLCFAAQKDEWKLESDTEKVSVFSRSTLSGYIEVKVITQLKTAPSSLIKLLDDTDAAPQWIANCRKIDIIDRFGNTKRTVRTYFSAPWPIKDRDMIIFSNATIDPADKSIVIEIEDRGREYATLRNYQRVQNISGTWTTTVLSDGMLEIRYQGYGEAAGSIPKWLANSLLIDSTHETFKNLRRIIVLNKYQDTVNAEITE